jgi:hypothetical protein
MPQLPARPTTTQVLEMFDGRLYRPVVRRKLALEHYGWGGSAPAITSFKFQFVAGARLEPIAVEVATPASRRPYAGPMFELLDEVALRSTPRFPVIFERRKHRIAVDGRELTFTAYTAGHAAVAVAKIGGCSVQIRCRRTRLTRLQLERITPDALRRMIPSLK